jgi:hypothetical protein
MIENYLEKYQTEFNLFCGYINLIGDAKADQCEELMKDFVYASTHDCLIEGMQELQVLLDSFQEWEESLYHDFQCQYWDEDDDGIPIELLARVLE